ncbi:MAG: hypothetical protein AAB518_00870, partial [Patescibacteria group bacterium]
MLTFHNLGVFLSALAFTYLSFITGLLVFRAIGLQFSDKMKQGLFAVVTGYGIWGCIGLALAGIGFFNQFTLWIAAIAVILVSIPVIRSNFKSSISFIRSGFFLSSLKNWFREYGFLKGVIIAWLFVDLFIMFVPLTGHDTLDYHFPIIQDLIREERFTFSASLGGYSYLPVLGETLYATGMVLFGNTTEPFVFQVFQYGMLIFFPLLFYAFLKDRVRHPMLAILGSWGVLSLMDFAREAFHGGYVDLFAFLFGMASVLLVLDIVSSGKLRRPELWLSAILLGFALGVKYTAFFFGAVDAMLIVWFLMKERARIGEWTRNIFPFAGLTMLVSGFWYIKNLLVFGNPVYPLGSDTEWFGAINYFLFDRTILNYFLFPFARYGQWFVQDNETSSRLVVLGVFILLSLTLFVFAVRRRG